MGYFSRKNLHIAELKLMDAAYIGIKACTYADSITNEINGLWKPENCKFSVWRRERDNSDSMYTYLTMSISKIGQVMSAIFIWSAIMISTYAFGWIIYKYQVAQRY